MNEQTEALLHSSRSRHLTQVAVSILRLGPGGAARLTWIYVVAPRVAAVRPFVVALWLRVSRRMQPWLAGARILRLRRSQQSILSTGRSGFRCATDNLDLTPETRRALEAARSSGSDSIDLAWIDQDGFFVWILGPIEGLPHVAPDRALPRVRTDVSLVDLGGIAAIRKSYRGDRAAFANEVEALDVLTRAGLRVPAVLKLDFETLTLYESFVPGIVVREELAKRGAPLRDRDVAGYRDFEGLSRPQIRRRQIAEGRKRLDAFMGSDAISSLADLVRKVHELGFLFLDIKYGNVVLERISGLPFLIDFGETRRPRGLGRWGRALLRDQEVEAVNEHYGTELPTRARLERRIERARRGRIYAPVHFGGDLRLGGLWDDAAGYARWLRILDRHMPDVAGLRVLDLGGNNGANALEMLRRGAREVVAIEIDEANVAQGKLVRDGVEWADNRRYALRHIRADMRDVPGMPLGKFDLVTALCCLYYLEDEQIARLARHVRTVSDTFIVQCNVERDIGRRDPDVYRLASIEFNVAMLRDAGFTDCRVIAPRGYSRPLVIGRAGASETSQKARSADVASEDEPSLHPPRA